MDRIQTPRTREPGPGAPPPSQPAAAPWYQLPQAIARRGDLTGSAKVVFAIIADRVRRNLEPLGHRALAAEAGLNVKTAKDAVDALATAGLICIQWPGNGRRAAYTVVHQSAPETGAPRKPGRPEKQGASAPKNGALALRKRVRDKEEKKKSRRCAPGDPRVREFLAWFCGEFEKTKGRPYVPAHGRDGKLIKGLLAALNGHGTDPMPKLRAAALHMLADPFWADKADIPLLAGKINRFLASPHRRRYTPATGRTGYNRIEKRYEPQEANT